MLHVNAEVERTRLHNWEIVFRDRVRVVRVVKMSSCVQIPCPAAPSLAPALAVRAAAAPSVSHWCCKHLKHEKKS